MIKPTYFPVLSGLRVILASIIFMYHYSGYGNHGLSFFQIAITLRFPMTTFFVLSGFVVMYSLIPKGKLTLKEHVKFILSRFIRLYPIYIFLLVVPYFQVGIPTLPVFLTNITLTKGFFKELFFSGIGPAWSLTPEITFYILVPIILNYITNKKKILLSYGMVLLTGLVLTLIGYYLNSLNNNQFGFFADIRFSLNSTFFGRATDFYVGMVLAWLIHQYSDKELLALLPVKKTYSGLIIVILISYLFYYLDNSPYAAGPILALFFLHILLPVSIGFFLWGLIKEQTNLSNFLSYKWMVILGNGSYGFYLMHTGWVQYKISKLNLLPDQGFILLWVTATLAFYLYEKPCINYLRKKLI